MLSVFCHLIHTTALCLPVVNVTDVCQYLIINFYLSFSSGTKKTVLLSPMAESGHKLQARSCESDLQVEGTFHSEAEAVWGALGSPSGSLLLSFPVALMEALAS